MQTETFDRIKIEQYHNRLMSHRLIIAHLLYNWGIPTVWQFYCITDVIRADTILLLLNCSSLLICRSIHISTFYILHSTNQSIFLLFFIVSQCKLIISNSLVTIFLVFFKRSFSIIRVGASVSLSETKWGETWFSVCYLGC